MSVRCWNAAGKLVADVGDYNVRYLGRQTITYPAKAASARGNLAGLTASGSFGVIVGASQGAFNDYVVKAVNGGYEVLANRTIYQNTTLTVDLYSFV
ncbi:hypothetical protein [Escherichia phage PJNS034]